MFIRKIIIAALVAGASAGRLQIRDASSPTPSRCLLHRVPGVGVEATIRLTVSNEYTNAVSFSIGGDHDKSLVTDIPQATEVFAVSPHHRSPPTVSSEGIQEFAPEGIHSITGVNEARSKLGLTGKGIKVAIIDTGIDYNHLALGGGFGPGKRVAYECACTHVAGIVGADPRNITDPAWAASVAFTGVAPEVTLALTECEYYEFYSVVWMRRQHYHDILAQSIYRAALDAQILLTCPLVEVPLTMTAPTLLPHSCWREGTLCHFASGNDGRSGIFASSSPANAPGVLESPVRCWNSERKVPVREEIEVVVNDLEADATNKQTDGSGPYPVPCCT
ncbi:peptidase S8/S53 domain-containing protein [Chytridium lagenaria]|nr:peptidase S8/S53 domain-containing protein [Chytridium lagenaria]